MEKLFTLLELQRRSQEAVSRQAFAHIVVNETHKLVAYTQAIFWSVGGILPKLERVSGTSLLDEKGPYALLVQKTISDFVRQADAKVVSSFQMDNGQHVALLFFRTAKDGLLGGLWLESAHEFKAPDLHILEELAASYAHALALLSLRETRNVGSFFKRRHRYKKYILVALLVLAFWPVHLSMTAPAEIIARDADIITIPFDGMIENVHVQPGDTVKKGQLLATMENSALAAQMDIAQQELKVTQSSVARLSRESLATPGKKSDLTAAESEIENKRLQFSYAQDMRERSEIKAQRDGIAVFSDAHSLQGKPMATGDKIMMIADVGQIDVLIRVPADAMIPVDTDADTTFFLNVSPLSGYEAKIKSIGYQASLDADGLLTYKIHATPEDVNDVRIGWKGTAKINSHWTILSYAILRRPLAALRRLSGL